MSESLGTYQLKAPSDTTVEVELFLGISDKQVALIDKEWDPILQERIRLAEYRLSLIPNPTDSDWQQLLQEYGCPDAGWDWVSIANRTNGRSDQKAFCIEAEGHIQAAMAIDLTKRCREPSQQDQHMVYVDRVAVAPWNRPQIQTPQFLKGLGKMALGVAVSCRLDENYEGRTGLHSLVQSEGFYRRCNMTDLGIDPTYENLRYFEFTSANARRFLK